MANIVMADGWCSQEGLFNFKLGTSSTRKGKVKRCSMIFVGFMITP